MAAVMSAHQEAAAVGEGEMTDAQMQALLEKAAARLRQNAFEASSHVENTKFRFPRLETGKIAQSYVTSKDGVAQLERARIATEHDRKLSNQPRKVEDPLVVKQKSSEIKKATAGGQWYNLPRTDLTPELKRDLQLLKMRNVLDPHRHYKKDNGKLKAPEYSQVGTIVEGPTEYYSARVQNKDRKRTLVEEVLSGEQNTGRFKKKYGDVQAAKTSGKKSFYKGLKAQRSTSYKKR